MKIQLFRQATKQILVKVFYAKKILLPMNLNPKNLKHLLITFKLGLEPSKPLNFISYPMNVDHIEEK